jgi:aldehyde:ferredoxin oxidoreductase
MSGPTGDRMIRVDMTDQSVEITPFPDEWKLLGGRSLAPTSGRISMGGKSPLTGGIKEANAGGNPGQDLMKLGYRCIVVKGQPSDPEKRYALEVTADGARVVSADPYKSQWNYALIENLAKVYPKSASFISIGPAGELRLKGASIACTDQEQARHPARHAARGGLGAVMGSKGLKYVSVDPGKARARQAARRKEFMALAKQFTKAYREGPQLFQHGTSAFVQTANMLNTFPYKNRVEGQSPDVNTLDGARIVESFEKRGGGMHNCMTGCIVQCSNVVHDAEGNYKTSALEFETLTLLGSNCAIASWEDVADLDRLCDEVGLDTVETGAAIAVYMDSGGMEWGDATGAKRILKEIADGTELGRTIGDGAVTTGKKRKHHRVPAVKGQALPAWDPRPLKATGITYCTSPMGADHTAGLIINPGLPQEEWVRASQESQLVNAVCDSSGFCQFLQPNLDDIRTYYGHLYGEDVTREQIADLGWQCLQDEWEFNRRAGFTAADDVMAECIQQDPIGPAKAVWDVPDDLVQQAYQRCAVRDELFALRASG